MPLLFFRATPPWGRSFLHFSFLFRSLSFFFRRAFRHLDNLPFRFDSFNCTTSLANRYCAEKPCYDIIMQLWTTRAKSLSHRDAGNFPALGEGNPRLRFWYADIAIMTKESSVFVDESGSFAPIDADLHSPFSILSSLHGLS